MIKLLCTNKLKSGPELEMIKKFLIQIKWPIEVVEFQSKKKTAHDITKEETAFFNKQLKDAATIILLDELGQNIKSTEFASMIENALSNSQKIYFTIGGANGIAKEIKNQAHHILSFGKATWPHLLCRIMLIEQIFRAQSILNNHHYHREGTL